MRVLRATGKALFILIGAQVFLGVSAVAAIGVPSGPAGPAAWQVLVRAAHQGTGALLLATSVCLAIWSRRMLSDR